MADDAQSVWSILGIKRLDRCGKWWTPLSSTLAGVPGALVDTFHRAGEAAGHQPGTLPIDLRVNGDITDRPLPQRGPLTRTVEEVAKDIGRLRGLGVEHAFWTMFDTDPDTQLAPMQRLLAAVGSQASEV